MLLWLKVSLLNGGCLLQGSCLRSQSQSECFAWQFNPESTLEKKKQSIACYLARELVSRSEWRTACASTYGNEAELLNNVLRSGEKKMVLLGENFAVLAVIGSFIFFL